MKNLLFRSFILGFVLFFVFGCGWIQTVQELSQSNANVDDKTRDALGLKKTGIPECDDLVDTLARRAKGNPNAAEESWQNKAVTELVKQQLYSYVNDGKTNKSPQEKADMAQKCRTALDYLKDEPKK